MGNTPNYNLPYPESDDVPDVPQGIEALATAVDSAQLMPVGAVIAYAGTDAPSGWLICNGGNFGDSYPSLEAVLGSTSTPNLVDRFIKGVASRPATKTGGSKKITESNMPPHNHAITVNSADATHSHTMTVDASGSHNHELTLTTHLNRTGPGTQPGTANPGGTGEEETRNAGDHTHNATAGTAAASHAHTASSDSAGLGSNYEPLNYAMIYLIKAY